VCTVYAYTVYGVLFSPLWLKSELGWPAISVSTGTSQQFRVGQKVWFGCLSAISQLASRVGEGGECGNSASIALHSLTLPVPGRWREQGGGLRSLPLLVPENQFSNYNFVFQKVGTSYVECQDF
jgi:hypothetical protein